MIRSIVQAAPGWVAVFSYFGERDGLPEKITKAVPLFAIVIEREKEHVVPMVNAPDGTGLFVPADDAQGCGELAEYEYERCVPETDFLKEGGK